MSWATGVNVLLILEKKHYIYNNKTKILLVFVLLFMHFISVNAF